MGAAIAKIQGDNAKQHRLLQEQVRRAQEIERRSEERRQHKIECDRRLHQETGDFARRLRYKSEPAQAEMPLNRSSEKPRSTAAWATKRMSASVTTQARPPCRKPSNWRSGSRNVGSRGSKTMAGGTADKF